MPELPDVEKVRRKLARWVRGERILAASMRDARIARPGSTRAFARALVGRRVERVDRKGKWLRFVLEGGGRLFSHLGMTGDWVRALPGEETQRSERARIDVGGASIRYVDPRRFGRLVAARGDISEWSELGPDPLADGLDAHALAASLAGTRRAVKDVLMDQRVLAGVGNILATEALWRARVDPRSPARALSAPAVRAIARALRREIDRELAHGGTGFSVYGRRGEPCPRCGALVRAVRIGGRTSAFCPGCQILHK